MKLLVLVNTAIKISFMVLEYYQAFSGHSFENKKMFRTRKSKTYFKYKVKKLMRLKKNDKLKSLIENEESYPTLSDSTGTTLLHMAARYDNVDMMQYSIDSGCGIDAKDATGTTPLIVATKYNNNLAMKFLLRANADVFATNSTGEYPLQLAFNRENKFFYSDVLKLYCKRVKESSSSIVEASDVLLEAGCSLDLVAIMQDTEMTRTLLENNEMFDDMICSMSVMISMFFIDSANLKVLFNHGSQTTQRIDDFLWYLHDITNTEIIQKNQEFLYGRGKPLETVRAFVKNIVDWNILNHDNLKFIEYTFEDANKDILREYLESDIVHHVQTHLDYNLLPHVYGNRNPGVMELLRDKGLDFEARDSTREEGETALHIAACRCIPGNVKILLEAGADPNIVDEHGETPLFCVLNPDEPLANKIDCIDLLLSNNADVEHCDSAGNSFIEYVELDKDDHLALADRVLAHLALLEATGLTVKDTTLDYIDRCDELRNRYERCRRQLEDMKTRKVARWFSLFTMLTSKPDRIARFVGAQFDEVLRTLDVQGDGLVEMNEYYSKKLRGNVNRALKVNVLRGELDKLIVDNIKSFDGISTVVDQIVSHFDYQDLLLFAH